LIRLVIKLYIFIIVIDVILSYIPSLKYNVWAMKVRKVADFGLDPIRRFLPLKDLPFDISPIILILLLNLFMALW